MALSYTNNYVTTLLEHSSDAQANLYYVKITGGAFGSETEALTVRCSGISIPETSQDKYSVRFMNAFVDRPKPKVSLDRTLSFTFRIDSQYDVYKKLLAQEKKTFDPYTGYTATDIYGKTKNNDTDLFNVEVYIAREGGDSTEKGTLDNNKFVKAFSFSKCWISNVANIGFKHTSSDAQTATVTVNYIYFDDKLNDYAGNKADNPQDSSVITGV